MRNKFVFALFTSPGFDEETYKERLEGRRLTSRQLKRMLVRIA